MVTVSSTSMEHGMISIDWVSVWHKPELVIEEIYTAGLSRDVAAHVEQIAGPGGGNPLVTLQGSKEAIKDFYVNIYMGGEVAAELDFEQFWKS